MSTNRAPHKERTIEKIRNAKVLERLLKHFNGELELSATQVNVGLSLIKKYLPDLKAVEHTGEVNHKHAQELTRDELLRIAAAGRAGDPEKGQRRKQPDSLH